MGRIDNLKEVFQEIVTVIKYSHANQPNPSKFDAKYLLRNLFRCDTIDLVDALGLILYVYIGEKAFTRKIGQ